MQSFLQDLRYAFRMLLKSPAFAMVTVLSLALGIGANTTIFTVINAVFLRPIAVEDMDRLVNIYTTDTGITGQFALSPISQPNFKDYSDQNQVFTGMSMFTFTGMSLTSGSGDPEQVGGMVVSGNYFDLLGVRAAHGRTFYPDEDKTPGSHPVVVLSHALWTQRFGADPALVGKQIKLNNLSFTVIGIAPSNFRGTFAFGNPDFWVPMAMHKQVLAGTFLEWFEERRALLFFAFGRMKDGVTLEQARAEMKTIGSRLEQSFPDHNKNRNVQLVPLAESTINPGQRNDFLRAGGLLMGAVALVLLIACANVANLMLARAAARQREVAVRISLGASRRRLIQQMLTESLVLAAIAGAVGLALAFWTRDLLWSMRPPGFDADALNLSLDPRVLGFTVGVSLLTGLIFGLVPALQASRPNLAVSLKDRAALPTGAGRRFGIRNILVMAQVALSLVALVSAGLFLRSLQHAQRIDPGFETKNLLVLSFNTTSEGMDQTRGLEFYRQAIERAKTLPMVATASIANNGPFAGGFMRTVFPEGRDVTDRKQGTLTPLNQVDHNYFDATGIKILRGRAFAETDRANTPFVAVINETMAKRYWPDQDALGKRFRNFGEEWIIEIVGIAKDAKYQTLGEEPQPYYYVPIAQQYSPAVTLHVRTTTDPGPHAGTIRSQVQSLAPNMPLTNVNTVGVVIDQLLWAPRMGAALLGFFGGLALLLAALGVYGVTSYAVNQRTQEIGIRMALGAKPADVLKLVLSQGVLIIGVGVVVGLAGAFGAMRALGSLLFGVGTSDPVTFASTAVLLAVVALIASFIPARRATKVDPMIALRYE